MYLNHIYIHVCSFRIAMGAMYVQRYFKAHSRDEAQRLVDNIRDEFVGVLRSLSWMDEGSRYFALDKVRQLTVEIGYPDELKNNTLLENLHASLHFDPENQYLNSLRLKKFNTDVYFSKLREPKHPTEWTAYLDPIFENIDKFNSEGYAIRELYI